MVTCCYKSDRKTFENEERVIKAFEEAPYDAVPLWVFEVVMSNREEDEALIDICIRTDEGWFFCQVKSSARGRSRFEKELPQRIKDSRRQLRYFCVVVRKNHTLRRIRGEVIDALSQKRRIVKSLQAHAVRKKQ